MLLWHHLYIPLVLRWPQKALYFPDIVGTKLDDGVQTHTTNICSGRISVIAMLSTKISEVGDPVPLLLSKLERPSASTATRRFVHNSRQ